MPKEVPKKKGSDGCECLKAGGIGLKGRASPLVLGDCAAGRRRAHAQCGNERGGQAASPPCQSVFVPPAQP